MEQKKEQENIAPEKYKKSFKEFMGEQKLVNRWFVLIVGSFGAFCGALLAVAFMLVGIGWH
jgi:hypothetical protein